VAIFKIFGKKTKPEQAPTSGTSVRGKSHSNHSDTIDPLDSSFQIQTAIVADKRHIGRATERKIDAIEFEMSRDMGRPRTIKITKDTFTHDPHKGDTLPYQTDFQATDFQSTIAMPIANTDFGLSQHTDMLAPIFAATETVPMLEEAAILYASGQVDMAEHMLQTTIQQSTLNGSMLQAWFMLFDLYQVTDNITAFDQLSLTYTTQFETSPPVWRMPAVSNVENSSITNTSVSTPNIRFPALLDNEIAKHLQKLTEISGQSKSLQLDFSRVEAVTPVGCGLLLRSIKNLNKTKHDILVIEAQKFTEKIRAIIEVGRRDETEAPWLLLLEVLQLLQLKEEFEETSIDYCVTFEVSPPAYETSTNRITMEKAKKPVANSSLSELSEQYVMPRTIEGKTDSLITDIKSFSELHDLVYLDCSQLEKVEFGASAQLLNGLLPIASSKNKVIEFHDVNYLIMHLFNAMGLKSVATIYPRKQA
jgi:ABC-type transporter Mla MlaB component